MSTNIRKSPYSSDKVLLIAFISFAEDVIMRTVQPITSHFLNNNTIIEDACVRRHHQSPDFNETQIYMAPP